MMKATHNIPCQSVIEEFLGREFFAKYKAPVTLAELVDLVQLEFQISDEDRKLVCENGHGTDGTILECYVNFALLRLQEKHCVSRVSEQTFQTGTQRYIGKTRIREVNLAVWQMKQLRDYCHMDKDTAMIHMAGGIYSDDVIEKAAQKVYETTLACSH